jgi:glycosyltransferase involved in cell wall biosynthesis
MFRFVQAALLLFRKKIFDFFFRKIDAFIVLSNSSREILKSYGIKEGRIFVVPLPPAPGFSDLPDNENKSAQVVLFMGWLQKRKGLDILIKAMSDVWKEFPQAKLKMIVQEVKWEQEYGGMIAEMLKSLPAQRYEYSAGQKDFSEIKSAISHASVIVIPEQWENMSPLLVIEAMQSGKAVVASRIGGIPEYVKDGETGFLAEYSNPAEFAKKILTLLKDNKLTRSMGRRAAESIRSFYDSARIPEKLLEIYERLVKGQSR